MTAGNLRSRVGFYPRQSAGVDSPAAPDYGYTQGGFSSTASFIVAAGIQPRLGGEQVLAARLAGTNLVNITVRQSTDTATVTEDWQAKDEDSGDIYNIKSIIDPDEGKVRHGMYFEMLCERGVAV